VIEGFGLSQSYFLQVRSRPRFVSILRKKRGALNRQLSKSLKLHEKSIGRAMKRLQLRDGSVPEKRGRPKEYGAEANAALAKIWEAMECPCAENMISESIDEYISFLIKEKDWPFNNKLTDQLVTMSEGTKKLRIASFRKKRGMLRGRSATVSSPLKGMIPIRKSHTWQALPVGYVQTDSVVHCGDLLTGDVVYSVGCVDYRTYWSEYVAQWNKGQEATRESLKTIESRFPFLLLEYHPDTGNEFINYHVHAWITERGLAMTRSEPYKKNDNMCIEERNNSIARKHLGYVRLDDSSLVAISSEILRIACLLHNHFRPVRRLVSKERVGAKWIRTFEKKAKTPYLRVLEQTDVSKKLKEKLQAEHEAFNPLELKRKLDKLKTELGQKLKKMNLSAKNKSAVQ
jgi:hypothetical protein